MIKELYQNPTNIPKDSIKLCTQCKYFEYTTNFSRMLFGYPICNHPNGWEGVRDDSEPLRVDLARQTNASCGEEGKNWEPLLND